MLQSKESNTCPQGLGHASPAQWSGSEHGNAPLPRKKKGLHRRWSQNLISQRACWEWVVRERLNTKWKIDRLQMAAAWKTWPSIKMCFQRPRRSRNQTTLPNSPCFEKALNSEWLRKSWLSGVATIHGASGQRPVWFLVFCDLHHSLVFTGKQFG